jgi:hypothetical protein
MMLRIDIHRNFFNPPKSCHIQQWIFLQSGFLYFGGHFGFKMATIANQRWISIRNIIIYLETKFRPNRRIFVFGGHFVPWLPWQRPPFWNFFNTCADYFRNFQNGRRCHGNDQNAKKLKNIKMIIAGYSLNRNWWNLIGTTSTASGTR